MDSLYITFFYSGQPIDIHCSGKELMKDIIQKFCNKSKLDKKDIYCLFDGNLLDENITLENLLNTKNKETKNIILVYSYKEKGEMQPIIKSPQIICPQCKEIGIINLKNYKFSINCKNNHNIKNIFLKDFENTQKIDESKILCNICKQINKSISKQKKFFICLNCKIFLCTLCHSSHNGKHCIIDYDQKNYICYEHEQKFSSYCKTCKKNLCIACQNNHLEHDTIYLGNLFPKKNELMKRMDELKKNIDVLKEEIKNIIRILNKCTGYLTAFYIINNEINNSFNINSINYEKLNNIGEINSNNEIFDDVNQIINAKDTCDKFKIIFNMYTIMTSPEEEKNINININLENNNNLRMNDLNNNLNNDNFQNNNYEENIIYNNYNPNICMNINNNNFSNLNMIDTNECLNFNMNNNIMNNNNNLLPNNNMNNFNYFNNINFFNQKQFISSNNNNNNSNNILNSNNLFSNNNIGQNLMIEFNQNNLNVQNMINNNINNEVLNNFNNNVNNNNFNNNNKLNSNIINATNFDVSKFIKENKLDEVIFESLNINLDKGFKKVGIQDYKKEIIITFGVIGGKYPETEVTAKYGITIDQLLRKYLEKINKSYLIDNSLIKFILNSKIIKFGDNNLLEKEFFLNNAKFKVSVIDSNNLIVGEDIYATFEINEDKIFSFYFSKNLIVEELLNYFFKFIDKETLKGNKKINFKYNEKQIESKELKLEVGKFFKNDDKPKIKVIDPRNLLQFNE